MMESQSACDLLLHVQQWFDGYQLHNSPLQLAIKDGTLVDFGPDLNWHAKRLIESDGILLPAVTDLHTHPDHYASRFGSDPDQNSLYTGVNQVISQGDAGALGVQEFVDRIIIPSQTDVKLAINISKYGESRSAASISTIEDIDLELCIAAGQQFATQIVAVSVNVSRNSCPHVDPEKVLKIAVRAAEELKLPILYGMRRHVDWPIEEQLRLLRPGDIVTYCFRPAPHSIVDATGILPEICNARHCGIVFDVGHGCQSFNFDVAQLAIQSGFMPDTISTDLQRGHIGMHPPHTLALVASKMMAIGMPLNMVLRAITTRPVEVLGLSNDKCFHKGIPANFQIFSLSGDDQVLTDCLGNQRTGKLITAEVVIQKGKQIR